MNICENTITVIGVQEEPETFVKTLSKALFEIDLDNLDPVEWLYPSECGVDATALIQRKDLL